MSLIESTLKRAKDRLSDRHFSLLRAFDAHCANQGLREKTRHVYLRFLTEFLEFLDDRGIYAEDLEPEHYVLIEEFFSSVRDKAPRSLPLYIISVKRFIKYLLFLAESIDEKQARRIDPLKLAELINRGLSPAEALKKLGLVPRSEKLKKLYEKIKVPRRPEKLPETLTLEEVLKIIDKVGDFKYKVAVALLYETGARAREILNLKIKDVNFDRFGARIRIVSSKSEPRVVRVTAFVRLLWDYFEAHPCKDDPEAFLFYGWSPNKPLSYNALWKRIKEAAAKAGIKKNVHPHLFRHTRATEFYGIFKEKEMMLWFGWKTRRMIDVYSKITQEEVEDKYLVITGRKSSTSGGKRALKPERCPRCSEWLPPTAKYCPVCGLPVDAQERIRVLRTELELLQKLRELPEL